MKTQLITVAALAMVAIPAHALQGLTTCHAAGTTATSISGFDTRTAKMTSAYTRPDAMEYCNREITEQHDLGVAACADRFMRDNSGVVITVWANCAKGTLTSEVGGRPGTDAVHGWTQRYKFPIVPMCGDDNMAAIAAFNQLCPSYGGKVEK
jgi:hypothetical protein